MSHEAPFWSLPTVEVLRRLDTRPGGLSAVEAARRGAGGRPLPARRTSPLRLLLRQFGSPLVLMLLAAATVSAFLHDTADAVIIFAIVLASGLLGFWQEKGAAGAMARLLALVEVRATVLRDGQPVEVPVDQVVPGDVLLLDAGSVVPADALLLEERDCFVDEAALTGESFPVEKRPGPVPADAAPAERTGAVFMGTHVMSGTARAVAVHTGAATALGAISERLATEPPETDFERGLRRFGHLLMSVTLLLVLAIFAINVLLGKPELDSFLFSVALAVGLTPQLLPAIVSINLARGARRLARARVIVKRLTSIEDFGSMDVLCSDKTGTLTEGTVHVRAALDPAGAESEEVRRLAWLNATFESGFRNPIDVAIRTTANFPDEAASKLDEVPYDFVRRRLSVLVETPARGRLLVTKGAAAEVLAVCTAVRTPEGPAPLDALRDELLARFARLTSEGARVLGVASRPLPGAGHPGLSAADEVEMVFEGFIVLDDPPKAAIGETLGRLAALGVRLKMITGDAAGVAQAVARGVGLDAPRLLTGSALRQVSDRALPTLAAQTDIFAEIEPGQKQRIILALRRAGHVVGYLGDGINDAPALHAAHVGLSVQGAVDVAREAADFVLLDHDLEVLVDGVREGRRTFANTLKYVFMATSANFGNMLSMALVSVLLPFLPLLPGQVLLVNLLTDLPEMTIAGDRVDPEQIEAPRRWDLGFVRRFMIAFGVLSSAFDLLTFAALAWWVKAPPALFRTAWFIESVVSACLIVLIIRTRQPLTRSRPARALAGTTAAVIVAVCVLPFTPLAHPLGFTPPPASVFALVAGIVAAYAGAALGLKHLFYAREARRGPSELTPPGGVRSHAAARWRAPPSRSHGRSR